MKSTTSRFCLVKSPYPLYSSPQGLKLHKNESEEENPPKIAVILRFRLIAAAMEVLVSVKVLIVIPSRDLACEFRDRCKDSALMWMSDVSLKRALGPKGIQTEGSSSRSGLILFSSCRSINLVHWRAPRTFSASLPSAFRGLSA